MHPFCMQESTETSQQCSLNVNEDIEEESTVGEFVVLLGPSHLEDSGNIHNSLQSLNPQGIADGPHSPPPSRTPKKRKLEDPASKAVSLLESIAKHASSVKEKSANEKFCINVAAQLDQLPRIKQRIARNRIQAILSESDEDESDHE